MIPAERYLNELIGRCFVNGFIEDIQLLMNFINQYPDKCKNQEEIKLVCRHRHR